MDLLQFSGLGWGRPWCCIAVGVWVQDKGEGAGTLGWSILSAGVSPRPGPRRWTMPALCACPIDSGCSGTLPWVPSMGSLRARGISLMGRQALLWLQTLGQRAQNKRYNRSRLATYTSTETRAWGERREKVVRRAMTKEETRWGWKGRQWRIKRAKRGDNKKVIKKGNYFACKTVTSKILSITGTGSPNGVQKNTRLPITYKVYLEPSPTGHFLLIRPLHVTVHLLHDRVGECVLVEKGTMMVVKV